MTGFLGRLAARFVGPAPMLGPRQPSMFEGARLADSASDAIDGGQAVAVEAASTTGRAATTATTLRNVDPMPPAGEVGRVLDRRSRRGRLSLIEPPDGVSPGVPPNPAPAPPATAAEHPRIFPRISEVGDTAIVARRLATGDEALQHGTLAARAPLYPAQPANASLLRVAGTPGMSQASPEPVVHVSIGRIELRATAPSKTIRHRDTPQASSLDDYLRQRGDRPRP